MARIYDLFIDNRAYLKFIILIFLLFISVRSLSLGTDISNSDAARWHRRSERFMEGIKDFDLKQTYQHYQPGVTLMWLNLPVRQLTYMYQRSFGSNAGLMPEWYPFVHGISKFFVVIVLGILLIVQLLLISKLYNLSTSLFYGFFMSLEPYLIGIDRWFHLTSLEIYFGFTAFLLILYALDNNQKNYIAKSGFFYALSCLSKFTSILTFPLYVYLIIKKSLNQDRVRLLAIFCLTIFTTVLILFPALLLNAGEIIPKLLNIGVSAASDDIRAEGTNVPFYLYYPIILLFKLSIISVVLLGISMSQISILFGRFKSNIPIVLYAGIYLLFLTIFQQKIDRYALVFIPPLLLLISSFVSLTPELFKKSLFAVTFLYFITISYIYYPVYSAYYSPLLGGTVGAIHTGVYDNSGEYFAQAAFELNSSPKSVKVYVPDNVESFSYFSLNDTVTEYTPDVSYVVKSLDTDRTVIKDLPEKCTELFSTYGPKDYEVIYVFKCSD